MSLSELKRLVWPPAKAFETGDRAQWEQIEQELGTTLPGDYREFVFAYGTGLFAGFYRIYNPFAADRYMALLPKVQVVCRYNRESQKTFPKRFPFPYFPEPGGLLPWGNDENGNDYFWLTIGSPEEWVVVQDENRGRGITKLETSFSGFLVGILQGKIKPLCSDDFQEEDFKFDAWDPQTP